MPEQTTTEWAIEQVREDERRKVFDRVVSATVDKISDPVIQEVLADAILRPKP